MRVTFCMLVLLVVAVATAANPLALGAIRHNTSCKAGSVRNASESLLPFREVLGQEQEFGRVRAPFTSIHASDAAEGPCFWYQITRYYTDASYSQQCGMLIYYCDGLVGSGGLCRTQFFTIETCDV
jgi:hypothetical protein